MKNDLTAGAWQHDIGCPISITLLSTSDELDKTLMADLSRQARQPMIVTFADAAYCYDRVNNIIMSLVWLVLTNGNISLLLWRP